MSLSERMPFVFIISAERRIMSKSDFPQDIFSGKEVVRFRQSKVTFDVLHRKYYRMFRHSVLVYH